ncbi:SMI1/KNR4 family protein, partial [Flavobacterium sp. PLA-1-15]|uniref:SMI1/KNR4 family protein n=1 Tax=Flavobacterium sp. PLA-1-15 TaxID=3380533 RepID=UPI003B7AF3ED
MKFRNSKQKLTNDELLVFEKQFNLNLPNSYKEVMLEYNGGYPDKKYFRGGGVYFLPIKYGDWNLEKCIQVTSDIFPKNYLPFIDYGDGSICLSLDAETFDQIYFINESGDIELVCNSFEEFMNELSDN